MKLNCTNAYLASPELLHQGGLTVHNTLVGLRYPVGTRLVDIARHYNEVKILNWKRHSGKSDHYSDVSSPHPFGTRPSSLTVDSRSIDVLELRYAEKKTEASRDPPSLVVLQHYKYGRREFTWSSLSACSCTPAKINALLTGGTRRGRSAESQSTQHPLPQ